MPSRNKTQGKATRNPYKSSMDHVNRLITKQKFDQALNLWEKLWNKAKRENHKDYILKGLKLLRKNISDEYFLAQSKKNSNLGDNAKKNMNYAEAIKYYQEAIRTLKKSNILKVKSKKQILVSLKRDIAYCEGELK